MEGRHRRRSLVWTLAAAALLCLLHPTLDAQERPVSWSEIRNLRFRKTDEALFSETEHSFSVEIEGVSPDRVQVTVNSLPQNVSFLSSKKESVTIKRGSMKSTSGTRITLWMEFSKSGFYQIDPVDVVIDKGFYRIPVGTVEVFENPRFIRPELAVSFEGKDPRRTGVRTEQGESLVFTVSVRGAAEIKDVLWRLPQDCLFKRLESYPLPKDTSPLSKNFIPLAKFQWRPLKAGSHTFPEVFVDARCFNGSYTRESPKAFQIVVFPRTNLETTAAADSASDNVSDAFLRQAFTSSDKEKVNAPAAIANEEALAFVSSTSPKRAVVILFRVLTLAAALLLVLCTALAALKHKRKAAFALALAAFCAVCAVLTSKDALAHQAVVLQGELYAIPEKDQSPDVTLMRGSVVFVERIAGEWALVRYGEDRGWIATSEIYLIK